MGRTPLSEAAASGMTDCCRVLLEAGADIDAIDECGNTALMYAVQCSLSTVQLLISNGADVEVINFIGQTAKDPGNQLSTRASEVNFVRI